MKIRIPQFLLALCFASFAPAQNGHMRGMSLAEALEIAGGNSYQIKLAESQVREMRGKSLESWSGFLPSVSLAENYTSSNDPVTVFGLKLKQGNFSQEDFALPALNNPDAIDDFSTALTVRQPILNLDAIYGRSATRKAVAASKAAAKRAQQAVRFAVKRAYFGLVLARANVGAIAEAVASAESHLNDARVAFEQGLINEADYLAAEVRLGELQEQHISAEHDVLNASDALKLTLGLEDDGTILPTDSLSVDSYPSADANESRADLQALSIQMRAAQAHHGMIRSQWLPRLNGFAVFEWNATQAFGRDGSNWIAGLQLQWQIFDGFRRLGRTGQTSAQVEQATIALNEARAKAASEKRKAERNLAAARKRIEVSAKAFRQASESLRITRSRFQQGLAKTSDLLSREAAHTNARLRVLKAKHDLIVAQSEVEFVR